MSPAMPGGFVEVGMVQAKKAQRSKVVTTARRSGSKMRDSDYAALAQFRYQIRSFLAFS